MESAKNDPEKLIEKAEEKLEPGFFKAVFSSAEERIEKAIKYYTEAAEILRMEKKWERAGDCFVEIGKLYGVLKESGDEFEAYDQAIECYDRSGCFEKYGKIVDKCVELNIKSNSFSRAAELLFKKIQYKKTDKNNIEQILEELNQVLDYYDMDKDSKEGDVSKVKEYKADLIVKYELKDDLDMAKFLYEELGNNCLKSSHNKHSAKEYFAKVILTILAFDDYITAKAYLSKFAKKDNSFLSSNIGVFIDNLISSFDNVANNVIKDPDGSEPMNISKAIKIYKNNMKSFNVDQWKESLIDKIKIKLTEIENQYGHDREEEDFK